MFRCNKLSIAIVKKGIFVVVSSVARWTRMTTECKLNAKINARWDLILHITKWRNWMSFILPNCIVWLSLHQSYDLYTSRHCWTSSCSFHSLQHSNDFTWMMQKWNRNEFHPSIGMNCSCSRFVRIMKSLNITLAAVIKLPAWYWFVDVVHIGPSQLILSQSLILRQNEMNEKWTKSKLLWNLMRCAVRTSQ